MSWARVRTTTRYASLMLQSGLVMLALGALAGAARADTPDVAAVCAKGPELAGTYTGKLDTTASESLDAKGILQCFPDGKTLDYAVTVTTGKQPTVTAIHPGSTPTALEPFRTLPAACKARPKARKQTFGLTWEESWTETSKKSGNKVVWQARAGFVRTLDGATHFRYEVDLYGPDDKMLCYALFQ